MTEEQIASAVFTGFGSTEIIQVDPGTIIRNGDDELTVWDGRAASKGRAIYVTPKDFEAVKSRCSTRPTEGQNND